MVNSTSKNTFWGIILFDWMVGLLYFLFSHKIKTNHTAFKKLTKCRKLQIVTLTCSGFKRRPTMRKWVTKNFKIKTKRSSMFLKLWRWNLIKNLIFSKKLLTLLILLRPIKIIRRSLVSELKIISILSRFWKNRSRSSKREERNSKTVLSPS